MAEVPVFFGLMSVVPDMAVASEGSAYKAELRRAAAAESNCNGVPSKSFIARRKPPLFAF